MKLMKKINLDIARFIAALMIVAIHMYPFTCISELVDYNLTRILFRVGVPFFLLITGYFMIAKSLDNKEYIRKYTTKILIMYFISIIIYIPINIYSGYFHNFNIISFIKNIIINGTMYHLWYFPALIMGIWVTYFLTKYIKNRYVQMGIFIILYVIGLFGDNYYGLIKNISIINSFYAVIFNVFNYTRNGLFFTPIFIYMGYLFNKASKKWSFTINILGLLLSLIFMLIEGNILYHYGIPRHSSMYVFLLPVSYFIFSILTGSTSSSNKMIRDISTLIYILHPLFIVGSRILVKITHLSILTNSLISYVIVLILTITCSYILVKIKNYYQEEKEYDKKLNLKI